MPWLCLGTLAAHQLESRGHCGRTELRDKVAFILSRLLHGHVAFLALPTLIFFCPDSASFSCGKHLACGHGHFWKVPFTSPVYAAGTLAFELSPAASQGVDLQEAGVGSGRGGFELQHFDVDHEHLKSKASTCPSSFLKI